MSAELKEIEKMLGEMQNRAPTVLKNAINRTTANVRKNMAAEVTKEYNIKIMDVRKTLDTKKATRSSLTAEVRSRSGVIALSKFKVTPNRVVTYRNGNPSPKVYKAAVKRGNTKTLSPNSFIAVMKSGHKGVFERASISSLPIKQLYGPSVPQMVSNEKVIAKIQREANETLRKRIDAEVNYLLGGAK